MTLRFTLTALLLVTATPAFASGKMTCAATPEQRKSIDALTTDLTKQGWQVRKAKLDGGCYEVYGTTPQGDRVEAYFDPVSFDKLLVSRRGAVLYKKP